MTDFAPTLLPYQAAWIKDENPMKLCEKSRRVGMTYAAAYRRVMRAARQPELDAWWLTRDLVTAREFIRYCHHWCAHLRELGTLLVDECIEPVDAGGARATCLTFANGSRIHVLSSNPDAAAGKGGDMGIDEYALHRHQDLLYQVARPVTMWGNQLEIISTHRGAGTMFHTLTEQARAGAAARHLAPRPTADPAGGPGWSHFRITLPQAVDAGLVERINAAALARGGVALTPAAFLARERAGCVDPTMWLQEYCCEPAEAETALLPYALLGDCEASWEDLRDASTAGHRLHDRAVRFAGMDVGRHHHFSVVWIVEELGDVLYTREVKVLQGMEIQRQEAIVLGLLREHGVARVCIDRTGIGLGLAETIAREYGRDGSVEGIAFTTRVQEMLALGVLRRFQDRAIRVPAEAAVREDLHALRRETTATGHVRYSATAGPNGHADRFWALALAVYAAQSAPPPAVVDGNRAPLAVPPRALR